MDVKPSVTDVHLRDLKIARQFVCDLIIQLDLIVNATHIDEDRENQWKYIWGDKENAVSSLTKLVGLLVKIIPIEQKINSDHESFEIKDEENKNDDEEIIDRYLNRCVKGECYGEDEFYYDESEKQNVD